MKGKMREKILIGAIGLFLMFAFMLGTAHAVPETINYQGFLTDSGAVPMDDPRDMTFRIYDINPDAGTPLLVWGPETHTGVNLTKGIFSVVLGESIPITASHLVYSDLFLSVQVCTNSVSPCTSWDPEMTPWQPLTSIAYAIRAGLAENADTLDGLDSTAFGDITAVNAGTGLSGGGASGSVTLNANTTVLQSRVSGECLVGSSIRAINSNGTVTCETDDIGSGGIVNNVIAGTGLTGGGSASDVTLNVDVPLSLVATATGPTLSATNNDGWGVYAASGGTDSNSYGVYGNAWGTSGKGVYGYASGVNGVAVHGDAWGSSGVGVSGRYNLSNNYGYLGSIDYGAYGRYGMSGPYGYLGSINKGLYGNDGGNANNHAGYFDGKVYVNGNVGIGTTSPSGTLDVVGGTASSGAGSDITLAAQNAAVSSNTYGGNIILAPGSGDGSGISGIVDAYGDLYVRGYDGFNAFDEEARLVLGNISNQFFIRSVWGKGINIGTYANTNALWINQNNNMQEQYGEVGIGTSEPTQKLDVAGGARFRVIGTFTGQSYLSVSTEGVLTTGGTSDRRLKTNIENIEDGLEMVKKLQGVRFNWKKDPEVGRRIGLIAQDAEKIIPELTFTNPTDGYMGINYPEITAVLIEAVKDQQKIIDDIGTQLDELKKSKTAEIESFKNQLSELRTLVKTVMAQQTEAKNGKDLLSMSR